MKNPSEPILFLMRDLMKRKGINSVQAATMAQIPRAHLRKVLTGREPMTVDELLQLSQALEISPQDLGLPDATPIVDIDSEEPETEDLDAGEAQLPQVDPWGNQTEQLFRIAFDLGCDFLFMADTTQLEDSGIPRAVLQQHPQNLVTRMDAAYHQYNEPQYSQIGITLTLSFDALHQCTFPWSSIRQVSFLPVPPDDADTEPEPSKGPHLRLVT